MTLSIRPLLSFYFFIIFCKYSRFYERKSKELQDHLLMSVSQSFAYTRIIIIFLSLLCIMGIIHCILIQWLMSPRASSYTYFFADNFYLKFIPGSNSLTSLTDEKYFLVCMDALWNGRNVILLFLVLLFDSFVWYSNVNFKVRFNSDYSSVELYGT